VSTSSANKTASADAPDGPADACANEAGDSGARATAAGRTIRSAFLFKSRPSDSPNLPDSTKRSTTREKLSKVRSGDSPDPDAVPRRSEWLSVDPETARPIMAIASQLVCPTTVTIAQRTNKTIK